MSSKAQTKARSKARGKNRKSNAPAKPRTAVAKAAPALRVIAPAKLRAPAAGFRIETVREKSIIAHITANPGFTVAEYGDQMGVYATEINGAIFFTREGRQLAEKGLVRIPASGRLPRWAKLTVNKSALSRRIRENQFPLIAVDGIEDGEILGRTLQQMSLTRQLSLRTSPKLRRDFVAAIDAQAATAATAHVQLAANVQTLIEAAAIKAGKAAAADVVLSLTAPSPVAKSA